uniref:Uncharacterized protein n=1 Tax=Proboscia inermis TaxID=420281 RepID=A0A7S0GJE1_9STRA|mmetsp:Transcript_47840/g.48250  ORF Transcript_47840/g.48250 Transcript_47840/m.48250 type:complete len:129 (+) Transcript_47840:47-433(+)
MNEHSTSSFKFTSNNSLTVPIANNITSSISGPGGGWNSVFAAASTIVPLETNLSDDEQPVNAVSGVEPCVSNISRLANTITDISPDTTISSNTKKKKKKKKKRKENKSSEDEKADDDTLSEFYFIFKI